MVFQNIDQIKSFIWLYRERSFTKAATHLDVSKVAITQKIAQIENQAGVSLFKRSTRQVTPTEEAELLYPKALQLLEQFEDIELSLQANKETLTGKIRITAPATVAQVVLKNILIDFQEANPAVEIDFIVTDNVLDLIEENIDISIRVGELPPSGFVGKKLGGNEIVFCTNPRHLKSAGPFDTLNEIKKSPVLTIPLHQKAVLNNGKRLEDVLPHSKFKTNDSLLVSEYARTRNVIAVRSLWGITEELKKNQLVVVGKSAPLQVMGSVWLLSSQRKLQSRRARALFEYIEKKSKAYF